jgi:Uma2 family endonuclease
MTAPATSKLVTAEELLVLASRGRYELVNGELIEMSPPGFEHGLIVMALASLIADYAKRQRLGRVVAAETGFRLSRNPDTVRALDVAFIAADRMPANLPKGYLDIAPDLIAEIVSPSDDPDAVQSKIAAWLMAGVKTALVVYPGSKQIAVYHSLRKVEVLTVGDTIELPDVLPGFACPVADIFA